MVRIILFTTDFLVSDKDKISRVWQIFLEFWVIGALQLCTVLVFLRFLSGSRWWVLWAYGVLYCGPGTFDNN